MQQRVTLYLKLNIFFEEPLKGSSDETPAAAVRLETSSLIRCEVTIASSLFFSLRAIQIVQRYEPEVKEIAQPVTIEQHAGGFYGGRFQLLWGRLGGVKICFLILNPRRGGA